MTRVRRVAAPIAAIWLLIHASTLVVLPAVFYASSRHAPIECTCVHDGNHRDCPMHHASPIGSRVCFQSTDERGFAALGSLLAQIAVMPGPPAIVFLTPTPLAVQGEVASPIPRSAAPEPPPPRA